MSDLSETDRLIRLFTALSEHDDDCPQMISWGEIEDCYCGAHAMKEKFLRPLLKRQAALTGGKE